MPDCFFQSDDNYYSSTEPSTKFKKFLVFLGVKYVYSINTFSKTLYFNVSLGWGLVKFHILLVNWLLYHCSFTHYSLFYGFQDEYSPVIVDIDFCKFYDYNKDLVSGLLTVNTLKEVLSDNGFEDDEVCEYNVFELVI